MPEPTHSVDANVRPGRHYMATIESDPHLRWTTTNPEDLAYSALVLLGLEVVTMLLGTGGGPLRVLVKATERSHPIELPYTVAEVPDWGWTGGAPGSEGELAARAYPERIRITQLSEVAFAKPVTTGAAGAPLSCKLLEPRSGAYAVTTGQRYRALVSLSSHFTAEAVRKYLSEHGWSDVAIYDGSSYAGPGLSSARILDLPADWPGPEQTDGLEDGHRWVRGEAVRTGEPTTVDVVSTVHKLITLRLSVYRIAQLWACSPASATQPAAPGPGRAPAPAPTRPASSPASADLPKLGRGPGPAGLDAGIPLEVARAVAHAWQTESDPDELRKLAATMRMGGFALASGILDQEALYREAERREAERRDEAPKKSKGRAIALGLSLLGAAAAVGALAGGKR